MNIIYSIIITIEIVLSLHDNTRSDFNLIKHFIFYAYHVKSGPRMGGYYKIHE